MRKELPNIYFQNVSITNIFLHLCSPCVLCTCPYTHLQVGFSVIPEVSLGSSIRLALVENVISYVVFKTH